MAQTIKWKDGGSAGAIRKAISEGQGFEVALPDWMNGLIPRTAGMGIAGLTGIEIAGLVTVASLAIFAGLAAYAIGKGYKVKRKGDKWAFIPPA